MIDVATLFLANAIVLIVMAGVLTLAWIREPDAPYWGSWVCDKALLVASLVFFILDPKGVSPVMAALSNMLLVAGFGFRWRAARQFNGRRASWSVSVIGPMALAATRVFSPDFVPFGIVFCLTNAMLALLLLAVTWEFWRDRRDGLASRWGLVFANAMAAAIFVARLLQGLLPGFRFSSIVTDDRMMVADLLVGLVYAASCGAFSLSLAFERSLHAMRHAAFSDGLTGLPNRRAFERTFAEVACSERRGQGVALAMVDIDHFKSINDRHGHAAGDKALRACASAIGRIAGPSTSVARIGGEEFAVLMVDVSLDQARGTAEDLRLAIAGMSPFVGDRPLALTVSIGLKHAAGGFTGFDQAMHQADVSLYAAKAAGRNRVELAVAA